MHENSTAAVELQGALGNGPIEFTIGSKSKEFGRLKLILGKHPESAQNVNAILRLRSESDSRLNLSEIALVGTDLGEMTNTWSGESEATSLSTLPPSTTKREDKGKGRDRLVEDPRRLQPHYRSLFDN
ncbi:hypothetical protein DL769_005761 [Monosporascus sp. CRB-8-3]|nr:hypothetical protein DL769_005761 [Monosporascus sp. CRB-8-3]